MQGLRIQQNLAYHQLTITCLKTGQVLQTLQDTELGAFYTWLKSYEAPMDYVEVPFNEAYIEIVYILKPQVPIVISEETVYQCLDTLIGKDALLCMEEIAATSIKEDHLEENYNLKDFLLNFYSVSTREEALEVYNKWQELIPFHHIVLYQVLEIMEYYLDEILNYFDFKIKTESGD